MRSMSSERLKPWVTGCCCSWSTASVRLEPPGPAAATSSSQTRTGPSLSTISTSTSSATCPPRSLASRPKALGAGGSELPRPLLGAGLLEPGSLAGVDGLPGIGWLRPVGVLARRRVSRSRPSMRPDDRWTYGPTERPRGPHLPSSPRPTPYAVGRSTHAPGPPCRSLHVHRPGGRRGHRVGTRVQYPASTPRPASGGVRSNRLTSPDRRAGPA